MTFDLLRLWIPGVMGGMLLVAACGDDAPPPPDAGPFDAAVDATVDAGTDGGDMTPPMFLDVRLTESPSSVLAYILEVELDEPADIVVDVAGAPAPFQLDGDAAATMHRIWIGGLRAEQTYDVTVTATDAASNEATSDPEQINTAALPADFPPVSVTESDPTRMAAGFTLFNVFRWPAGSNGPDSDRSWLVAVDGEGEVVWYHVASHRVGDARLLDSGNVLYNYGDAGLLELDREGATVREWAATAIVTDAPPGAIEVDTDSLHHETLVLPNGNFLALSSELRTIETTVCPNYMPASGTSLDVVGDVLVEFEPDTGMVVAEVSVFDSLDPCRRTDRGFAGGFWNTHYGGSTTQDWTHGNAIEYDETNQLAVVSLRHSDWVVAYRYEPGGGGATGDVAWILGDEGEAGDYGAHPGLAQTGAPFDWMYHQHAPAFTSSGTLLLFDNGNLRPGTNFEPADAMGDADLPYSRVVEYAIDTSNADSSMWTLAQVWEWVPDVATPRYAPFLGDSDELDNGNVLMTFGGIVDPASDAIGNPAGRKRARIVELDRSDDSIVLDFEVVDTAAADFVGYSVYRAERINGFIRR